MNTGVAKMNSKIEQKLQFRDARCCKKNNKCSNNVSGMEQLLNMAIYSTTSLKLETDKIILKEEDTRFNVINFKHKKEKQIILNKNQTANDNSLTQCISDTKTNELQQQVARA